MNGLSDNVEVVDKSTYRQHESKSSQDETDQIIADFTDGDTGVRRIVKKFGCHYSTISRLLKSKGLTSRPTTS